MLLIGRASILVVPLTLLGLHEAAIPSLEALPVPRPACEYSKADKIGEEDLELSLLQKGFSVEPKAKETPKASENGGGAPVNSIKIGEISPTGMSRFPIENSMPQASENGGGAPVNSTKIGEISPTGMSRVLIENSMAQEPQHHKIELGSQARRAAAALAEVGRRSWLHCIGSPKFGTQPAELSGFYHDLKDNDTKKIAVGRATFAAKASMGITPPQPSSSFYVEGVGQDWEVLAGVDKNCSAVSIDFRVPNKPSPPPTALAGRFLFGKLSDIEFLQTCRNSDSDPDTCGAIKDYPYVDAERPVWHLYFPAGNVWVKAY